MEINWDHIFVRSDEKRIDEISAGYVYNVYKQKYNTEGTGYL